MVVVLTTTVMLRSISFVIVSIKDQYSVGDESDYFEVDSKVDQYSENEVILPIHPERKSHSRSIIQNKVILDMEENEVKILRRELKELFENIQLLEKEIRNVKFRNSDLEEDIELLRSKSNKDIELLRGRILEQAKMQINQLKTLLEKKLEEQGMILHNNKVQAIEIEKLEVTLKSQQAIFEQELAREKAIASSYKHHTDDQNKKIENLNEEIWRKDNRIKELLGLVGNKDQESSTQQSQIKEDKDRIEALINDIHVLHTDNRGLQVEIKKLKDIIAKFNLGTSEEKLSKSYDLGPNQEDLMKYKFEVNNLRKQLATNKERMNIDTSTAETQCKIIEEMVRDWFILILTENQISDDQDPDDLTTGEMQHKIRLALKKHREEQESKDLERFENAPSKIEFETQSPEIKSNLQLMSEIAAQKESISNLQSIIESIKRESFQKDGVISILKEERNNALNSLMKIKEQQNLQLQSKKTEFEAVKKPTAPVVQEQSKQACSLDIVTLKSLQYFGMETECSFETKATMTKYDLTDEAAQVCLEQEEYENKISRKSEKIKELKNKLQIKEKKIVELEKEYEQLREKMQEDFNQASQRDNDALSVKVKTLQEKVNSQKRDITIKEKLTKNLTSDLKTSRIELKDLQIQLEALRIDLDKEKAKVKAIKKSTKKQGDSSSLKAELLSIKADSEELFSSLEELTTEKALLTEALEIQLSQFADARKENKFLSDKLNEYLAQPPSLELELLSQEETQALLESIIKKAVKSNSLIKEIARLQEFGILCKKIDGLRQRTKCYSVTGVEGVWGSN